MCELESGLLDGAHPVGGMDSGALLNYCLIPSGLSYIRGETEVVRRRSISYGELIDTVHARVPVHVDYSGRTGRWNRNTRGHPEGRPVRLGCDPSGSGEQADGAGVRVQLRVQFGWWLGRAASGSC